MFFISLLVVGVVAWFVANRVTKELSQRVRLLETQLTRIELGLSELLNRRPDTTEAGAASPAEPQQPTRPPEEAPSKPLGEIAPKAQTSVPPVHLTETKPSSPKPTLEGRGLEERIGTMWAVRVGGVALALGGIFLVRYTIEVGLLGPEVRVFLGALLAAALIVGGEWLRRTEIELPVNVLPSAHIPSTLTAAGTIVAFATIYAAHALYGFIGPALAFLLLGSVGIITMLAAAIHGPALAGLGLAGAFITPILVSSNAPDPLPVALYLGVVAGTAYALARTRHWLWLAGSAVLGAFVWGLVFVGGHSADDPRWHWAAIGHALAQLSLGAFFLAYEPHAGAPDRDARLDFVSTIALAALGTLCVIVLDGVPFDFTGWLPFAALAVATLSATAWASAPAAGAAVLGGLVGLGAIGVWPGLATPPPVSHLWPAVGEVMRLPDNVSLYLTFATLVAVGVAASASLRLWNGRTLPVETAAAYALAATAIPLLVLIIAYLRVTQFDQSVHFSLTGVLLGALFAWAAEYFQKAASTSTSAAQTSQLATGAFAAAAIAAMSFALVTVLSRGYLTVAIALSALGTAYVATIKDIPILRYAVAALGIVVLGRVAWDPRIMGSEVGRTPILNWLLLGYGVPAAAFALAARLLARRCDDIAVRLCDGLAVLFTGLLLFFQIRHALNGGDPLKAESGYLEQGLLTFTGLGLGYVLTRLDLSRSNPVFNLASLAYGVLAAVFGVLGLAICYNPLLSGEAVTGMPILGSLLPAYLLPGIAALYVARTSLGVRPYWYTIGAEILGLLLILLFVSLEVRHAFQGPLIDISRGSSDAEQWAYSAAWLALGILFLVYGIWRGSAEARAASGALVALAVIKVFLFDLAGVTGLWRALSFIGLGAVLIGIGFVYQKLLFAKPRP